MTKKRGGYYLRSRYYAVHWCRFVNADSILSKNLFVYCNNNPIPYTDADGNITKNEAYESPYVYFSYLLASGCKNIHPMKMDQMTFNLSYTVHPGQYVFIFYDDEDPYGSGVNRKGYYSGGVWAQVNNSDEWELIPIFIKPQYLTDDLGEVLFTQDIYTWKSDDGRLDEIMPHIWHYIDKYGFEPYPKGVHEQIKFFQKKHNCRVDGIVGEETLEAIENMLKKENPLYNGSNPAGYR